MGILREEAFYSAFSDDFVSYTGGSGLMFENGRFRQQNSRKGFVSNYLWSPVSRLLCVLIGGSYLCFYLDIISLQSFLILSVSVLFTWSHIWLALYMCFYPLEFMGIGSFGWQGIVPRKAHKMASKSCDLMIDKLIIVSEIIDRISPVEVCNFLRFDLREFEHRLQKRLVSRNRFLQVVPDHLLSGYTSAISEAVCIDFVDELKLCLNDKSFFDLKALIVSEFVENKHLLIELFTKVGKHELIFIQLAGCIMGIICGAFQIFLATNHTFTSWVFFPISGLVIGYFTNWLALYMIFHPVEPMSVFGLFTVQGLFLTRQSEASLVYAEIVTSAVLNVEKSIAHINTNGKLEHVKTILRKIIHVHAPTAFVGDLAFDELVNSSFFQDRISHISKFVETQINLEETLANNLIKLPPKNFEQMLHPVFQEDELLLIIIGAVLGAVVGGFQLAILRM